jgi:carbamoylphosphate synthase small subunit
MSRGESSALLSIVMYIDYAFGSQNHQYALKLQDPFPEGWEPFFINCNDSSVEGIKSTPESGKKVWGVQFHPESAGGPLDTIEVPIIFYLT